MLIGGRRTNTCKLSGLGSLPAPVSRENPRHVPRTANEEWSMKSLPLMVAALAGFAAGVAVNMSDPIARAIVFAGMFIGLGVALGLMAMAKRKGS